MTHCPKCPRKCKAKPGFCNSDSEHPEIAAVYAHTGEEPPISGKKGISNIFFAHCNLQCVYCQNHSISRAEVDPTMITLHSVDEIVDATAQSLKKTENIVGLVSATQYSDLAIPIVEGLHKKGLYPTIVYNTNGYESVDVLRQIADYVDIYLPDFKYSDHVLARSYSNAADYPDVAAAALKEMYNQKGSSLPTDNDGLAFRGLVVRHLVLPGQVDNSIRCLEWLADNLSPNIYVSLMAQYYPPEGIKLPDQLARRLKAEEYEQVVDAFYSLGFHRGWVQELDASECYRPHFGTTTTFGNKQ
jgi:putative pyruvate formate lyase activating enzyme